MGGFVFAPKWVKESGEWQLLVLPSPCSSAKKAIMDKIRSLRLHTRTGSIYVVANLLNPLIRGWQNYYCHFIKRSLNDLWRFVNRRLEKWCKWNKRLSLRKSRRWLNPPRRTKCNPACLPTGEYAPLINCKTHLEEPYESSRSRTVL